MMTVTGKSQAPVAKDGCNNWLEVVGCIDHCISWLTCPGRPSNVEKSVAEEPVITASESFGKSLVHSIIEEYDRYHEGVEES